MRVGDLIAGRYVVRESIGRGGMGEVYLVFDQEREREFAMKLIRPDRSRSKVNRRRFLEEARIASALEHEHVVAIHAFGVTEDGRPYFVMDYCSSGSLASLRRREGRLAPKRAVRIVLQLLDALKAAHHQGILHRDIKPGNIMVDDDDRIRILDFGLAKDLLHTDEDLVRSSGRALGTPLYMSPEHVRGQPLDQRTDLYAAGLVLFELLCGFPPLRGPTSDAVMRAHLTETPPPPSDWPGVPAELDPIVLKALAKERRNRWQTAREFAAALSAVLPRLER